MRILKTLKSAALIAALKRAALIAALKSAALITALGAFGGCNELEDIEPGECGNGIIDAHEDCDTFAIKDQPETACRQPGQPDACRFDCSKPPEGSDLKELKCPDGYGCGANGSCRAASGKFESLGDSIEEDVIKTAFADFDGDGRKDLMTVGGEEIRVRYYEQTGLLARKQSIRARFGPLAIGQLTEPIAKLNDTADFAFSVGTGFGVMRGQQDRTLLPTQYPFDTGGDEFKVNIIPLDALPDRPGDEALAFLRRKHNATGSIAEPEVASIDNTTHYQVELGELASVLVTPIATGKVFPEKGCDELVLAFVDPSPDPNVQDQLLILTPCIKTGIASYDYDSKLDNTPYSLKLPVGHRVRGRARVVDIDDDGLNDVVVSANAPCKVNKVDDHCCVVDVAYGTECGGLSSTLDPIDDPDGLMSTLNVLDGTGAELGACVDDPAIPFDPDKNPLQPFPLAFGDLNKDGLADMVAQTRIYQAERKGGPNAAGAACSGGAPSDSHIAYRIVDSTAGPWSDAVIADFNLDGIKDVVGSFYKLAGLDFYQGDIDKNGDIAAPLSAFAISTQRPPRYLTVGNFDGDLAPDIAFGQIDLFNEETGDSMAIAFGEPLKPPSAPLELGRVDKIQQLVAGDFKQFTIAKDSIRDLVAVSQKQVPVMGPMMTGTEPLDSVLLLPGSTDRQLQSPVRLANVRAITAIPPQNVVTQDLPALLATGQFTSDNHEDVAVLAYQFGSVVEPKMGMPDEVIAPYQGFALWMLQSEGEAEFRHLGLDDNGASPPAVTQALTNTILDGSPDLGSVSMVAVDLTGTTKETLDGIDEIVLFVESQMDQRLRVFTANVVPKTMPGPAMMGMGYTVEINDPIDLFDATDDKSGWVRTIQTEVADMDNDGRKDVVVLFEDIDKKRHLAVLWNNGDINGSSIEVLKPSDEESLIGYSASELIYAFTILNADDDKNPDIAFVTENATYIAEMDSGTRTLNEATALPSPITGGTAIAAGDITGDGVDELVVGSYTGAHIFLGIPLRQ